MNTMFGIDAGALVVASIDEEEVWVSQFVGEEEQYAFQRPRAFVNDISVEKVLVVGRGATYK